ncbi:MAG: hypothetical protein WBB86_01050 [Candidatus Omnitrophota bacterium]
MKKLTTLLILTALVFYAASAFALTDRQRAEQRRQQQAAKRAYEASSRAHNEVADRAETYKEGAEFIRDNVKKGARAAIR